MFKIKIHNVETNEIIEREMNDDEIAQLETDKKNAKTRAQLEAEQYAAKAALLQKLDITEDEARLLLS